MHQVIFYTMQIVDIGRELTQHQRQAHQWRLLSQASMFQFRVLLT